MRTEPLGTAVAMSLPRRASKVPSMLWCGFLILLAKVAISVFSFGHTVRWIYRRIQRIPERASVDWEGVKATEHAIAMTAALYPGRARCLEQSLVLYYVLGRQGVRAEFKMGIQPFPFVAHAWIEYQGQLLNDVEEHVRQFARFQDLTP